MDANRARASWQDMVVNNFLHLYLNRSPTPEEVGVVLRLLGFKFQKIDQKRDPNDPVGYHWRWNNPPLSDNGFKLVFFHKLFSDDRFYGKFNAFVMMSGSVESSQMDVAAIDISSRLLLNLYGGRVFNPEAENTASFLCGAS